MSYLELTKDLTTLAVKELKVGQVLIFDFEGSPVHLKIMRKKGGRVWAKRLDSNKFLTAEEADEKVTVVPRN
jgi:hypothetical protein